MVRAKIAGCFKRYFSYIPDNYKNFNKVAWEGMGENREKYCNEIGLEAIAGGRQSAGFGAGEAASGSAGF
jgi:hypothetical protein